MDTDKIMIVDYSDKAIAIAAEYDTGLQDEFKAIGGRFNSRLAFGAGWIFSKKKHREQLDGLFAYYGISDMIASVALADIVGGATGTSTNNTNKTTRATRDATLPDYITTNKGDVFITLSCGGCVEISKRNLITDFCFGYSDCGQGATSEEARAECDKAQSDENYFLSENLSDLQDIVDCLKGTSDKYRNNIWLVKSDSSNIVSIDRSVVNPESTNAADSLDAWERRKYNQGLYVPPTDDDKQRLIAGYEHALTLREKRCRTYLKRYGLSKLHCWVYWADA